MFFLLKKEKDDTGFSQVHRTNVVDSGTPRRCFDWAHFFFQSGSIFIIDNLWTIWIVGLDVLGPGKIPDGFRMKNRFLHSCFFLSSKSPWTYHNYIRLLLTRCGIVWLSQKNNEKQPINKTECKNIWEWSREVVNLNFLVEIIFGTITSWKDLLELNSMAAVWPLHIKPWHFTVVNKQGRQRQSKSGALIKLNPIVTFLQLQQCNHRNWLYKILLAVQANCY